MRKLSEIVLGVLDASATQAALRFSVRGLGLELCKAMLEGRRAIGVGGSGAVRSHSLFLWVPEGALGDSWPMPAGVKSGSLKAGQLISARNVEGISFVTLYPSGGAASDSQVQAETELTAVLTGTEKVFFKELGYEGGVPAWYPSLCEKLLESHNLRKRWDVRSLQEVRWKVLESVDRLVCIHGQEPQYAFASVIGVPCEPTSLAPTSHVSKENWAIVLKLADFMSNGRSRDAAMKLFEEAISSPGVFENPDEVRESLAAFFDWLLSTDYDSDNWSEVLALYGLQDLEDPKRFDESWRSVLNREVWVRLLRNYRELKKVSIEVRDAAQPSQKIQPQYEAKEEVYLVEDGFHLSLLNDGQPHPAGWNFYAKANAQFTAAVADSPRLFDLSEEDELAELFKSKIRVTPKVEGAVTKKGPFLLCISRHDLGLYLLSAEAKSIEQPEEFEGSRAEVDLTLESAGDANVVLCYDKERYRVKSVQLDGLDVSFADNGHTAEVVVQNNSEEQSLAFCLTKGAVDLSVEVLIAPAEVSSGKHQSYLHNLAAMHVKQKKLPLNVSALGGEERRQLLAAVMECKEGWPAALLVGEALAPFRQIAHSFHLCLSEDPTFHGFLASKHTGWTLPPALVAKRQAVWEAFQSASAGNPAEQTDFTIPGLHRAGEEYLSAFNDWYIRDQAAAIKALEAMDSAVIYQGKQGDFARVQYLQLPLHPLRLRGLLGLYDLLREEDSHNGARLWHPPLSRLCSMVGPRFWSINRPTGKELYQINGATSPYYPIYSYFGAVPSDVDAANAYLHQVFACASHQSSLSLSSSDVPQLMNDVCTLNSSLSQLKVYLQSDPLGEVSDGLIEWYVGTGDDDDSLGNIYDDWVEVSPLNLSVFSNSQIIEGNEIDGKVASCADIPGRKLVWTRLEKPAGARFNAAIIAEVSPVKDNDTPAEGLAKPQAVNLHRIGCEWRLEYKLQGAVHAETFGSRGLVGPFNAVESKEKDFVAGLIDGWSAQVAAARKNFNYRMGELTACVDASQFVALPVSSNSGILAAAGLSEGSAVWKYKQGGFGAGEGGTGHIILTKQLDLLAGRFDRILRRAGLVLTSAEQKAVMTAMGRAGLNTLHHLSDNEQSLLGAVSSVAVMRAYPRLVAPFEGAWPTMVLPLDPFEEQFVQLKSVKRPDFLCFTIKPEGDRFRIIVTVLEAKWRKTRLDDRDLADMLNDQCVKFQKNVCERFTPSTDSPQRKTASSVLLSELLICAIRLFAANNPDKPEFAPDKSAQKCSNLIDALFNGRCSVEWGRHMLAVVSHNQASHSTDYSGGDLLRLSVKDCVGLLRNPDHEIDFSGELPPPVFIEPVSAPVVVLPSPTLHAEPPRQTVPVVVAPPHPVQPIPVPAEVPVPTAPPVQISAPAQTPRPEEVLSVSEPPSSPAVAAAAPVPAQDARRFNQAGVRIISIKIGQTF
jgi:hypothetical protein